MTTTTPEPTPVDVDYAAMPEDELAVHAAAIAQVQSDRRAISAEAALVAMHEAQSARALELAAAARDAAAAARDRLNPPPTSPDPQEAS